MIFMGNPGVNQKEVGGPLRVRITRQICRLICWNYAPERSRMGGSRYGALCSQSQLSYSLSAPVRVLVRRALTTPLTPGGGIFLPSVQARKEAQDATYPPSVVPLLLRGD